jgi:hypothetical protein
MGAYYSGVGRRNRLSGLSEVIPTPVDYVLAKHQKDEICGSYMRERSDNPILRAFRHVALSVRFRFLAILPAGVFFRASDFKVRTSAVVQARLLNPFFTI